MRVHLLAVALLIAALVARTARAANPAHPQFQLSSNDEHSYEAAVSGVIFEPDAASFKLQHRVRTSRRAQPLPKALRQPTQPITSLLSDSARMRHVTSVSFNSKLGLGTQSALSFSHPLIARRVKNMEPEGVHLMSPGAHAHTHTLLDRMRKAHSYDENPIALRHI